MTDDLHTLDLDAARADRAKLRAAKQESRGETLPIRFGGAEIAVLGPELPLSALEPLTALNVDIAMIVRQALNVAQADEASQRMASLSLIVDLLAVNKDLPQELLTALGDIGRRVLGADGYTAFFAANPTVGDIRALITGLLDWYGISLGESSPPSPSSDVGETPKQTSNGITESTPVLDGVTPATPESLGSAGS